MRIVSIILILFLLLASSEAFANASCNDLMRSIMRATNDSTPTRISSTALKEIMDFAKAQELDRESLRLLKEKIQNLSRPIKKDEAENFIVYLKTLREQKRPVAIRVLEEIFLDTPTHKMIKKFKKIQKKINYKHNQYFEKMKKKIVKKDPTRSETSINRLAARKTRMYMNSYRKLSFECRSNSWNDTRRQAAKTFKKFTIGVGLASSFGAMAYQNQDRDFSDWGKQFAYEAVMGIIGAQFSSKIISNPNTSDVAKSIQKYFFGRGWGLVDMVGFGMIFGADQDEVQARYQAMMKDPQQRKNVAELVSVLEEKRIFQRFKDSVMEFARENLDKIGIEIDPPIEIDGIDWNNLTEADLENEDVQSVIMAAIVADMYEEGKGNLIATGNVGSDRYAFSAAYGLVMLPKDMFVNLYIYNILCLGLTNPKTAFLKAAGVFLINRIVSDQLYYFVRRFSINQ